ncbi:PAAR-like domain-containing protein [uncultured Ruegeria sp.]|uniref:PAAR-like domain-containing protein n=1 Tax=uncultured Ruegeria sp. TaxID=259304 RepID=UPI002604CF7B|nr:PAAR-like domain-containing protein [uncultured Ruegeria sp.]
MIAAFPDVCFTPPQAPPTPPGVPIPYPSFGSDGDTDKGTGTVKIGGETINLKNNSHFTKTTGTEAGSASKKGIISSKNTGKAKSQAYSMNVKAEGKNICRFSDIETNNHGSPPNAPPWPKIGQPWVVDPNNPCADDIQKMQEGCKDYKNLDEACDAAGLSLSPGVDNTSRRSDETISHKAGGAVFVGLKASTDLAADENRVNKERMRDSGAARKNPCLAAIKCKLVSKKDDEKGECCGKQTGHHLVPESSFSVDGKALPGVSYDAKAAPCVCAEGATHNKGSHGLMHNDMYCEILDNALPASDAKNPLNCHSLTYGQMRDKSISSMKKVFPESGCSPACIKAQLDAFHEKAGVSEDTPLRADKNPGRPAVEARRMIDNIQSYLDKAMKMAGG